MIMRKKFFRNKTAAKYHLHEIFFFIICIILIGSFLSGCQKTPEKNSVARKDGGLQEGQIAEPLKKGELHAMDIPEQWQAKDTRADGKVTITADMSIKAVEVGNLPVIAYQNKVLSNDELKKMTNFFAKDETLYRVKDTSKEDYDWLKKRIENGEGYYGSSYFSDEKKEMLENIDKAIKIAPSSQTLQKISNVKFMPEQVDEARNIVRKISDNANSEDSLYFSAQIGEEGDSIIRAEKYNSDAGTRSTFVWDSTDLIFTSDDLESIQTFNASSMAYGGDTFAQNWQKILDKWQEYMNGVSIDSAWSNSQAKDLLSNLGLDNYELYDTEYALVFERNTIPHIKVSKRMDYTFLGDPADAEDGVILIYTPTVSQLPLRTDELSTVQSLTDGIYAPPFEPEKIEICITKSGIMRFSWDNICEQTDVVAENTNLLSFDEIQNALFDQIYFQYANMGQPAESKTKFEYKVSQASFGYSFIPAYKKPDQAWAVPSWVFVVSTWVDDSAESGAKYEDMPRDYVIDAIDGALIATEAS